VSLPWLLKCHLLTNRTTILGVVHLNNKALVNRSLINLCLDLVELDPTAEENKTFIDERLNELGNKVDNYVGFFNFTKSQVDMLEAEIAHLKKQVSAYEHLQENLKHKAMSAMDMLGTDRLDSDNGHKISIRESESVEIDDLTKLPDEYVRTKIIVEPDKISIKYALKKGEAVQGARLIKNKNVQIK
jgi:Siphovirus Gp157